MDGAGICKCLPFLKMNSLGCSEIEVREDYKWICVCPYLLKASVGFLSHSPGCKVLCTAGSRTFSSYPGTNPLRQIWATRPRINPPTHSVSESSARQKWKARLCWCRPRWVPCADVGHNSSVHSAVFPLPGPPTSNTPQELPDFADPAVRLVGLDAPPLVPSGGCLLGVLVTPLRLLVFSWRQCWILWKTHSRQ